MLWLLCAAAGGALAFLAVYFGRRWYVRRQLPTFRVWGPPEVEAAVGPADSVVLIAVNAWGKSPVRRFAVVRDRGAHFSLEDISRSPILYYEAFRESGAVTTCTRFDCGLTAKTTILVPPVVDRAGREGL